GLFDWRITIPPRRKLAAGSVLREPRGRDRSDGLQPDPASSDMTDLARQGERAELVGHHVDPADLAQLEGARRRDGQPEAAATRVLGAPEQRFVVHPQTHGPCDGKSRMTPTLGRETHWSNGARHVHVPCHRATACHTGSSNSPVPWVTANRKLRRRCHILIGVTKRVLIVDDEPPVVEVLKDFFRQFRHENSYETESAKDGAEALVVLLRGNFDLILLDMHMPRMGGLELLKQIRGLGVNVPIIMITANADTRAAAEALGGGVFAYIPKPFDIRHLDHLVALAISTGSPRPK